MKLGWKVERRVAKFHSTTLMMRERVRPRDELPTFPSLNDSAEVLAPAAAEKKKRSKAY